MTPCLRAMAYTKVFSLVKFCSLGIALLVALLMPSAHVEPVAVPEHEKIANIVTSSSAKVLEQFKSRLSAKGFSTRNIYRLQRCALLCGQSAEARLQSRIFWLLKNKTQAQIGEALLSCSPVLGDKLAQNLKQTGKWFSEIGLMQDRVVKSVTTCPLVLCIGIQLNLEPTCSGCWI